VDRRDELGDEAGAEADAVAPGDVAVELDQADLAGDGAEEAQEGAQRQGEEEQDEDARGDLPRLAEARVELDELRRSVSGVQGG
jgi:hypothetical protein